MLLRFFLAAKKSALSVLTSRQSNRDPLYDAQQQNSDPYVESTSAIEDLNSSSELRSFGIGPDHWAFHAWLQWLPFSEQDLQKFDGVLSSDSVAMPNQSSIGLQLGSLEHLQDADWESLRGLSAVFDPSSERVQVLQERGVQAQLLSAAGNANGWLKTTDQRLHAASETLGLPPPQALLAISEKHDDVLLCLGTSGEEWEANVVPPCIALPAFDDLVVTDWQRARNLACWLNTCCRLGIQLARVQPTVEEFYCTPYRALEHPQGGLGPSWITPPMFWGAIQPSELVAELAWLRAGRPAPELPPTPTPVAQPIWVSMTERPVAAAICISLHNYSDRIVSALESCAAQTEKNIELLIVDDASEDDSAMVVQQWLDTHAHRFVDARLLRHPHNCGLAAARNTAFAAARSAWCFVLDADNRLDKNAVQNCLSVASHCSEKIAVVHSLVELREEHRSYRQPEGALLTRISWQKEQFLHGNLIDAMALVRRNAWERVGGYTHIPGGWEDFDFWCKLIDAGLGGVLCPQRLAIYTRHRKSMQATQTVQDQRRLKRIMMKRYPWLCLEDEVVM